MPTSLGETLLFLNSHTILISRAPKSWSFGFLTLEADLSWRRLGVRKLMSMRIFFFFLPFAIIYCISPGRFLSFSLLADIICSHWPSSSIYGVCWLHLDSTGGTWIMESLPQFCFILAKCPQSVKTVFVGLWSQELLGTSWTWLCPVYFLPLLSPVMY